MSEGGSMAGPLKRSNDMLAHIVKKVGWKKGRQVWAFMGAWGLIESRLGHQPTLEEYAKWWKVSRATAFREQALFRECFPDEATPSRLNALVWKKASRADLVGLGEVEL